MTVKALPQITSGISAAQIAQSPDRTASDVVKRVPGITVMEDRFVVVRGLAQRYNNAWLNGLSAPGTEPDSRAFPFDLIPSSQIDNLLVFKSPSPEIPADFSGGFIKITSKGVPDENKIEINLSTGINAQTHFENFKYNPGSNTDWLGFDGSKRVLPNNFPAHMGAVDDQNQITDLTKNAFNRDWDVRSITPLPDRRLAVTVARRAEK
ncbi:MAG: TonB-dependent receptor plug domain-containing protein, partial [Mycoplasmataceae bacterium]|nr:TonB-dependent receptor plug domain-containing protein [Mycoplasmataceae bacterium]